MSRLDQLMYGSLLQMIAAEKGQSQCQCHYSRQDCQHHSRRRDCCIATPAGRQRGKKHMDKEPALRVCNI